jgi:hypothetical protein
MINSKYSGRALSLLVVLPLLLTAQRAQENVIPLKNWATPLYWQANQAEREARAAIPAFYECRVHGSSHVRRDHALPFGGHARLRWWI